MRLSRGDILVACNCGIEPKKGDHFCRSCGDELEASDCFLCECGAEVMLQDSFCHACGSGFDGIEDITQDQDDDSQSSCNTCGNKPDQEDHVIENENQSNHTLR